jgi:hypothetical protein
MQLLIEAIIEFVPRAIGWAVLKLVTLGRYRGWGHDDLLLEGGVGLVVIAGISLAVFAW